MHNNVDSIDNMNRMEDALGTWTCNGKRRCLASATLCARSLGDVMQRLSHMLQTFEYTGYDKTTSDPNTATDNNRKNTMQAYMLER